MYVCTDVYVYTHMYVCVYVCVCVYRLGSWASFDAQMQGITKRTYI